MEQTLKVKDIRAITGLTGAEIAWFYHQGVVKVSGFSNYSVNGKGAYKEFSADTLPKFQQIAMYYDLGLRRDEIRDIMTAKDYDFNRALDELYVRLKEKRDRMERHMIAIENLKKVGTKGRILDHLRDIRLEDLGENYQKLHSSTIWEALQEYLLQKPVEDFTTQMEICTAKLARLDEMDLNTESGSAIISEFIQTLTVHMGLMGYMMALGIAETISGEGTASETIVELVGAEISKPQARAISEYLKLDFDRFLQELADVIVRYHQFPDEGDGSAQLRDMVNLAKSIAQSHFGISEEIEYRLLFELLPPMSPAAPDDYLNFLYYAVYCDHQKEQLNL